MAIKRAERRRKPIKGLLAGPSGSGKTMSALKIAKGLVKDWDKISVLDTENGSANLYADLGEFGVQEMQKPFLPERYEKAIKYFEREGVKCMLIDSLSHAWFAEGGVLDIQQKFGGRYQDWQKANPHHYNLLQAILSSPMHILCTVRKKTAYSMEMVGGKAKVKKLGLESIQRDGLEFEFDFALDIDSDHNASSSKDRTHLFSSDVPFLIKEETGERLHAWSMGGQKASNI